MYSEKPVRYGQLSHQFGYRLPLRVLSSPAGFYLGTANEEGPVSRESVEYFTTNEAAEQALDSGRWTQRNHV